MEIIQSLIEFFGLTPEFETFPEFIQWFVTMLLAVTIVVLTVKALFTATWKIERSLR